jgi:hypothetical protein
VCSSDLSKTSDAGNVGASVNTYVTKTESLNAEV